VSYSVLTFINVFNFILDFQAYLMDGTLEFIFWYRVSLIADVDHCIIEGPLRKRHHADSAQEDVRRSRQNRPRAIDIPQPVRAAPASWTVLTAQIQYAWTYNAAVAKIICDGARSMHSEDLSSRIVTQSELLTPHCFHVTNRCHSDG
jgi:hypothetical protein